MRAVSLREFGPPSALEPRRGARTGRRSGDRVAYANITFVETQVRAGRGAVPSHAPDDPRQRRRRLPLRPPRVASLGGIGRLRRTRRRRRRFRGPPSTARSSRPSRCWPTVAPRRCSPTRPRSPRASAYSFWLRPGALARCSSNSLRPPARMSSPPRAPSPSATWPARSARRDAVNVRAPTGGARRRLRRRRRERRAGRLRAAPSGACSASGSRAALGRRERGGGRHARRRVGAHGPPGAGAHGAALAGDLTPVIGQRFPLERAADAHAAIEARATVGKTLLVVQGE